MTILRVAGLSDRGRHHDDNQDRWLVDQDLGLMLVCDGMGEAITPEFVAEIFPAMLGKALPPQADLDPAKVGWVVTEVNRRVLQEVPEKGRMTGSTLVLALIRGDKLLLGHLGDSRAYRCRDARLEPLTVDHSYLQRKVQSGAITAEEAARSRHNGGPTRFLGMPAVAVAETRIFDWKPGDKLMLCTDGLPEMLPDNKIEPLLAGAATPEEACRLLVDAALQAGGLDNVTVVVSFAQES